MQNSVPDESPENVRDSKPRAGERWYPQEEHSWWWRGVRVVLCALDTFAALNHEGALAVVAKALIAIGDVIVDAGEHKRS